MKITCYGGVNEIGGNKILVEFPSGRVLLDFGVSFKCRERFYEEYLAPRTNSQLCDYLRLGILPRVDGLYREDALTPLGDPDLLGRSAPLWQIEVQCAEDYQRDRGKPPVDALLLTHGHDDHFGLIGFLGHLPIYCSPQTHTLLEAAVSVGNYSGCERDVLRISRRVLQPNKGGFFPGAPKIAAGDEEPRHIHLFEPGQPFTLQENSAITVQPVAVGHSVPGSVAFVIRADGQTVVYSGDIRFHGRWHFDPLESLGGLQPDVLLLEGTRITSQEHDDETRVLEELVRAIHQTQGLAMIGFRWKDVERYETMKEAAEAVGRELVIFPRLAYLLHQLGYDLESEPGVYVYLERSRSLLYSPADYVYDKYKAGYQAHWLKGKKPETPHLERGVTALDLNREPERYVFQLDYWRFNNLLDIKPPAGSSYIRASTEPFNEEMELSDERLHNWLKHFGINPEQGYQPIQIHASGHASGPELLQFARAIEPKTLIPIHTEYPEIYSKELGDLCEVRLPQEGEPLEF
ncbi:MAG: MBL fold metallo-hydrolase [Candidatus Bipolaricaulia bacterium]